jgi:outer membrane protein assembly factor BamB
VVLDGANIYFGGKDSSNNNKIYKVVESTAALAVGSPLTAAATVVTPPALSGGNLFLAMTGHLYKIASGTALTTDSTCPIDAVNGRVNVSNSTVYTADDSGKLCAVSQSTFGTTWSQQDTANHGASCLAGGVCAIKGSPYIDGLTNRIYYGDNDGHLYVRASTGAPIDGFPFKPNNTTESFQTPVFYRNGVIAAGTTSGTVFLIDQATDAAGNPLLKMTYSFGSAVSGIGFDSHVSRYMVGTASGRIYYIDELPDTTQAFP